MKYSTASYGIFHSHTRHRVRCVCRQRYVAAAACVIDEEQESALRRQLFKVIQRLVQIFATPEHKLDNRHGFVPLLPLGPCFKGARKDIRGALRPSSEKRKVPNQVLHEIPASVSGDCSFAATMPLQPASAACLFVVIVTSL
jgi:hypothetical protein